MEQNPESTCSSWQFISFKTGTHLFLTGKAGTGKTTFLRKLKQESPKRMVVVAYRHGSHQCTVKFFTIHRSSDSVRTLCARKLVQYEWKSEPSFRFGKEKINIIRSMDLLVIDEISMVRADLLDAVDEINRRYRDYKPF